MPIASTVSSDEHIVFITEGETVQIAERFCQWGLQVYTRDSERYFSHQVA